MDIRVFSSAKIPVSARVITYNCTFVTLYSLARHDYKIGHITAKPTSYRVVFDLFSLIYKKPRLILCRKKLILCDVKIEGKKKAISFRYEVALKRSNVGT